MSKVTLSTVGSLIDATTAATTINSNFDTIKTAFDNTLSRNGILPNQMAANLDMGSNHILNLPEATSNYEPVTYGVFNSAVIGQGNMPAGGTTGQILQKNSNTSYDVGWFTLSSLFSAGVNIVFTGISPTVISTSLTPTFTKVNGLTITTTTGTLTLSNVTAIFNSSFTNTANLTLAGTDGTTITFQSTDTYVGRATTDTLTNKTLTTPVINGTVTGSYGLSGGNITSGTVGTSVGGTGQNFSGSSGIALYTTGVVSLLAQTGSGNVVRATSPTLVTPVLGVATATSINGVILDNNAWSTYTPTVTSTGGTITTVTSNGSYKVIGKTAFVRVSYNITALGSATGDINLTFPPSVAAFTTNVAGNGYIQTTDAACVVKISTIPSLQFVGGATQQLRSATFVFETT